MPALIGERPTTELPGYSESGELSPLRAEVIDYEGKSVPFKPPLSPQPKELSTNFCERLLEFASWEGDWDGNGARPIASRVARAALRLAKSSLQFAPEPFVAPAVDGSLLLRWDLPHEDSVELYVEDPETWDVVVDTGGKLQDVKVSGLDDFLLLLGRIGSRK